jgi:RNA polymerase sigma-70 factor (ECF subfamily)
MYTLNDSSFKTFFDKYCTYAVKYSHKILGTTQPAQDIVTEVFMKIWQRRESFETQEKVRSFLFICCHNDCLNLLKKKDTVELTDKIDEQEEHISSVTTVDIMKEIANLPTKARAVFELKIFAGLNYKQIGKKLHMSYQSVAMRYHYAVGLISKKVKIVYE